MLPRITRVTLPRITYHTPPDELGRRRFTLEWEEPDGVYRPEAHPADGKPVGRRRGQVFYANPESYLVHWRAKFGPITETQDYR